MKPLSIVIFMISACLSVFAQDAPKPVASPQPFRIIPQPDAPLRIISSDTQFMPPDDRGIEVYVVVENVSPQLISTYSTLRGSESAPNTASCLGPPGFFGRGLKPGQKAGTSSWQMASSLDSKPAVWIDFVELADGTRWGADKCAIGEFRDGESAGAQAQNQQLLKMFRDEGAESLMKFINDNFLSESYRKIVEQGGKPVLPIAPPEGHSRRWEEGFSAGARTILRNVIDAERDHGVDEIEHVLLRPNGSTKQKSP
jgi:hypothetical protein